MSVNWTSLREKNTDKTKLKPAARDALSAVLPSQNCNALHDSCITFELHSPKHK